MSSLVLLNSAGKVARTLKFVTLPDDYVIPEGMTVSWMDTFSAWFSSPAGSVGGPQEPLEAYFYFGDATAQVRRTDFQRYGRPNQRGEVRYGSRTLTITVQGTSATDVMRLRDRILHLINSGASWGASNDLNPRPKIGLVRRLKQLVGAT
jgi:hypothetical protein